MAASPPTKTMNGITEKQYKEGGYGKFNLKKDTIDRIHTRVVGPDGKVYQGEAGTNIRKKMLEKQKYYERNS